jgi:hypothetical protein
VFAVAADQIGGLSSAAFIAAGLAIYCQRRVGTDQIRTWTRARSGFQRLVTRSTHHGDSPPVTDAPGTARPEPARV